jgi:carboxyvinyl-carboxyphosphonate phosphorylmutase
MSDVVDHCRRITRIADVSLMVDAEDGFGNAVNVVRTVREMESAGVAGIEIEDNFVPRRFNVTDPGLVSTEEQAGKLEAAVAARTDPTTVIVARSAALGLCPLDEALERIQAYSQTGAEALMLTGSSSREQLEAVHAVTSLPLCVLNPPADARNDQAFLDANGVRILMLGNPTYAVAVQASTTASATSRTAARWKIWAAARPSLPCSARSTAPRSSWPCRGATCGSSAWGCKGTYHGTVVKNTAQPSKCQA